MLRDMDFRTAVTLTVTATLLLLATAADAEPLSRDAYRDPTGFALNEARAGAALHEQGEHRAAIDRYRRAQHALQREEGVHTLNQLLLVDWISVNFLQIGQLDKAGVQQRFYYDIVVANHGAEAPEALHATVKLAEWYQVSMQLRQAKRFYNKALAIIEHHHLDPRERKRPADGLAHVEALQRNWLLEPSTAAFEARLLFSMKAQRVVDDPAALAAIQHTYAAWLTDAGEITAGASMHRLASNSFLVERAVLIAAGD